MKTKYKSPLLLERVIEWQQEIADQVPYLETPTGLHLGIDFHEKEGYFCTPVDSFPFAQTGMDGIHFAVLTDFGNADDLSEAPVIRVSPMDDERVRLVARNLHDFFCLYLFDQLLMINEFSSEAQYLESLHQEEADDRDSDWFDHRRWQREKAIVGEHAQKAFKFAPIDRAFRYIQDIRQERQAAVSIMTDETLGVMPLQESGLSGQEVKLAAVRNLQAEACSDRVLVERSARDLIQMGMALEAGKLRSRLLE